MTPDSQLVATIVRMVVPLRREYGLALDVHQFIHDSGYAAAVLDKARGSVDPKLRDYAAHVEKQLLGPRAATAAPPPTPASPSAPAAPARQEAHPTEDELRSRMLRKHDRAALNDERPRRALVPGVRGEGARPGI